ncbi:MAG: NADH-quinone oxidoreductase subunit C, partial [Gammaproteobacteria bacterium]
MSKSKQQFADALHSALGEKIDRVIVEYDEVSIEVSPDNLIEVASALRDQAEFGFEQLIDLCGVDYSQFGQVEWQTEDASRSGFSRGVDAAGSVGRLQFGDDLESVSVQGKRFAAVYHLMSY